MILMAVSHNKVDAGDMVVDAGRTADGTMIVKPVHLDASAAWIDRPNDDGFWWMRDGDREPEVVRVEMQRWYGDGFWFYSTGSEIETGSREIKDRASVRWQRVAPAVP